MSAENPGQPGQPEVNPPGQTLLPPAAEAGSIGAPPPWFPGPPPAPVQGGSVWNRLAAFVVLIAVVAAIAGAGIGFSLARAINPRSAAQATLPGSPIQAATPSTGSGSATVDAIAAKVSKAIVDVNTTLGNGQAAGTGMLISSTGEILTNNHVVSGSTSISVTIPSRTQTYSAHVVGVNVSQDVAVIQIDSNVSGLPTVTIANSSSVHVGDTVIAIGNALGQGGAPHVTQGQVIALDQTITASTGGGGAETLNGMIQSDALIYEGDSGGALVNTGGQVIGMITAGQAQGFRSTASDVGYAIASNTALSVVNRILAHEQAADLTYGQVGYLGVSVQSMDAQAAQQLGLNVTSGALVTAAPQQGTPAADAGITRYSVITKVGDSAVTSADTLGTAIKSHQPGDSVTVNWVNSSGSHSATVTLAGVNP
ncbi:MAG TPA: trypsin-like peptidase domain-containing protein [Candidatus Limnocylindrales bacterium]|nr:trypsin-like peptidase domain-containing protein [Candidatus Limnocylindrales bacterium]